MSDMKHIWRFKVEMILKGLIHIQELARHSGYHPTRYIKHNFEGKVEKINGINYIPKIYLTSKRDLEAVAKCSVLDDYLPLDYVAKFLLFQNKKKIEATIKFQRMTNQKIFEYKKINANYFIKIPKELQEKLKKYVSYSVTDFRRFDSYEEVKDSFIFGDNFIVFC